ncbi:TPA: NUMOD3 domain-containing DNA-binding protein [Pseudomonas putida]
MDYAKIYAALIGSAKARGLNKSKVEGYFETHHVIPRCMGGSDELANLVMLTAREHYMAHMLLWKMHPAVAGVRSAAMMMSNRAVCKVNSHIYAKLRAEFANNLPEWFFTSKYHYLYGQRFTRLLVIGHAGVVARGQRGDKVSMWDCICDCGTIISVGASSLRDGNTRSCGCLSRERATEICRSRFLGKKLSPAHVQKLKDAVRVSGPDHPLFGKKHSPERRAAASALRTGVPWSKAQRLAYQPRTGSAHQFFGKSHTEKTKRRISQAHKVKELKPWENACSQKQEHQDKWAMCGYYYDLWLELGKPGLKKFTRIYNEKHSGDVSLSYFTNPRLKWVDGWNPHEDPAWQSFYVRWYFAGLK